MGARGRKPDQRRERERGAHCRHASFPWCAFRSSVASVACVQYQHRIVQTHRSHPPPQDTYVFTKGVARLEGAVFLQTELALCLYLCNARPSPIRTGPPPYSTSLKPAGSRPSCRHWTTAERSRGWSGEARDIGRVQTFSEVWSLHPGFFRTV